MWGGSDCSQQMANPPLAIVGMVMFFFLWLYDEWADSGFLMSQVPTIGCALLQTDSRITDVVIEGTVYRSRFLV